MYYKEPLTTEQFIKRAQSKFGEKYNYYKVDYYRCDIKVIIICNNCNKEFKQSPSCHLQSVNGGCPNCTKYRIGRKYTLEEFIEKANKKHNNKYDYSKSEYINGKTDIIVICPEHKEFRIKPSTHLQGYGCPECDSLRTNYKFF